VEALEERTLLTATHDDSSIVIRIEDGTTYEDLADVIPGATFQQVSQLGIARVLLPERVLVADAVEQFDANPGVRYAELNQLPRWKAAPNDARFDELWAFENTGQVANGTTGTADADTDAVEAWDGSVGDSSVIVAIVDSGLEQDHPDLVDNLWVNPGEIAGDGIDNDNNGFIDDIHGWDFEENDGVTNDPIGHGTHVAGIAGATGDNGIGVTGINQDVSLMGLKLFDLASAAAILEYAWMNGARVSNHSYGFNAFSQAFEDAVVLAEQNDHLVVVAAGNNGGDITGGNDFPALFDVENVLVVAATNQDDQIATFSDFSPTVVDLGAPGVNILSTTPQAGSLFYGPEYDYSDGTSMASPMVAGAAGYLLSLDPSLSYPQLKDILMSSGDPLPSLASVTVSGNRLNLARAAQQVAGIQLNVFPGSIREDAGANAATGLVRRFGDLSSSLSVSVVSSDTSELTVPSTVTIPAGSSRAFFSINAVDDTILDGTQTVGITASLAGGTVATTQFVDVTDVESLTLTIDRSVIEEDDGTFAAVGTISRSSNDGEPPNILVTVGNEVHEYDTAGTLINSFPIEYPGDARPLGENARDIVVTTSGNVAVYNGENGAFLSQFDGTDWTHQTLAGFGTAAVGSGALATHNEFIFATDQDTPSGAPRGVVRFDANTGQTFRLGQSVPGDRLFAATTNPGPAGHRLFELDPVTGEVIRSMPSPTGNPDLNIGLAYDGNSLWYIEGTNATTLWRLSPDSGGVIEQHDIGIGTGFDGLAALNGEIYLLDSFIQNDIVVWDPVAQQVSRILDIDDINGINISGGLTAATAPDALYVTDTFASTVYELDPSTGVVRSQFTHTLGSGGAEGLATVGQELYIANFVEDRIQVHDRSGDFVRNVQVQGPGNFSSLQGLGGDAVPGPTANPLDPIDVATGFDGTVYSLDSSGTKVQSFAPGTLRFLQETPLDRTVSAISVDSFGRLYGAVGGEVHRFSLAGNSEASQVVISGSTIIDLDIAIGGSILASTSDGIVATTDITLETTPFNFPVGITPAFVAFSVAPGSATGDIVVSIDNTDPTEISVPASVTIPAGQTSVTFPIGAVDDAIIDGTQTVTLTPVAGGYIDTQADSVDVLDIENLFVTVTDDQIAETDGPNATTVSISRSNVDGPFDFETSSTASSTPNLPILDQDIVTSTLEIPDQVAFVSDVKVNISLEHGHLGDLDVFLLSPSGTRVELFTDVGGIGQVIDGLTLDGDAASSIVTGSTPFSGRFTPEGSFAQFNGEPVSGGWTLEITDDTNLSDGMLLAWGIEVFGVGFAPLDVTLTTSDSTEAEPRSTVVTIPANKLSIELPIDAIDDALLDGTQNVVLTATGGSFVDGSDSFDVTDEETLTITFDRDEISEDAGASAAIGTVTRSNDGNLGSPLVVTLDNRDRSEITVPDTITIPAGQTSATFVVDAADDNVLDGRQRVRVNAVASGYRATADSRAFIFVTDSEPILVLDVDDAGAFENEEFVTATITRTNTTSLATSLSIALTSNNANATVPPSVTIPVGQASTTFTITLTDNDLLDGDRDVTITASAGGTFPGSDILNLRDFETLSLSISGEFDEADGAGAAIGTVTRNNTNIDSDVVVTLTNDDDSELTTPATVTIPAGSSSVDFPIDAVNDDDFDGPQEVLIGISATGYVSDDEVVVVNDHEPTVVTSPDNRDTTLNPRPTVRWRAVEGATSYRIRFRNVTTGEQEFIVEEDLPADITSYTPPRDLPLGNYDIFVGYDDERELAQPESVAVRLRVRTAPEFTSPRALAGTDPVDFAWTAVTDADEYQLVVNDLTRNRQGVVNERNLTNTSFAADLEPGVYEAFVRAWGNGIRGTRTRIRFTVLLAPEILTPAEGNSWDRTPTFTFTGSEGADHYDVRIHDLTIGLNNGGQNFIRDRFVIGTEFTPETELEIGHRYAVYVSALTEDGLRSLWTDRFVYEVGLPPVFVNPTNGGTVSQEPVFRWEEVAQSKKYDFRIRVQGGSGNIYRDRNVQSTAIAPDIVLEPGSYTAHVRSISLFGDRTRWSRVEFVVASSAGLEEIDPQVDPLSEFLQEDASASAVDPTAASVDFADKPVIINSYVDETTDEVVVDEPAELIVPAEEVAVPMGESIEIDSVMEQLPTLDAEWWAVGQESPEFSVAENLGDLAGDVTPTTVAGAAVLGAALVAGSKRKKRSEEQ
jgi:subtilisin family serine protease/subtilisin-like proprotein convertase family protein